MIRIGIVGTGNTVGIAHFHTQGLIKDGRAVIPAVFDLRLDGASKWVKEHNLEAKVCSRYEELLDCVDAVNICVPNMFHCEYALKAIEAGKHFLVEKPMAVNLEDSKRIYQATRGFDKVNMVGFVYRYAHAVQLTKKVVEERIGKVFTFTSWFGGKRLSDPTIGLEWRMMRKQSGNGALGDFGSHLVDLADFVAGQRYDTISCLIDTFIPYRNSPSGLAEIENDDAAVWIAKGSHGIGNFTVSRVGLDDLMLLITGEGGMVQVSLRADGNVTYWEKKPDGGYTGKIENLVFAQQKPFDGWFEAEMTRYLDAIEGKTNDYPDVEQGYYVERVLDCAEKAFNAREVGKI